uniref:hypothetical protein n=1 Tax=uncultured Draconibacterium sp. TaxID=1573823 RepID=UPI0032178EC2
MNKQLLIVVLVLFSFMSKAADVITLNNQMAFEGKVKKIKDCTVKFKMGSDIYEIPSDDIFSVQFENPNDKVLLAYQKISDSEKCLKGRSDADIYHGKAGLHIALGVLFGPFAVIGAAAGNPTPEKGKDTYIMTKNREMFSDPAYLTCYKKKAKGQNVGNTALGWAAWVLLLLAV